MKNTLKNIKVKDLSGAAISYEPVMMDGDYASIGGHDFYSREACTCDKCGATFTDSCGDTQHRDIEDTDCNGWLSAVSGPAMAYCYPLPSAPTDEEVMSLKDLPLCVLHVGDEDKSYLALTGGGMDLSWDICEGYIRLGYLPPASMCQLPEYAGMELNSDRKKIISACKESIRSAKRSLVSDLNRLNRLVSNLKDNAKK